MKNNTLTYFSCLTRGPLNSPEQAGLFLSTWDEYISWVKPETFADENERQLLIDDERALFDEQWCKHTVCWNSIEKDLSGFTTSGGDGRHHGVLGYFPAAHNHQDNLVTWLSAWSELCKADFTFFIVQEGGEGSLNPPPDEKLAGFYPVDMQDGLPTVPWAVCFGKPFVDLFTRKRIDDAPFFDRKWLTEELVYCQLTESSFDSIEQSKHYADAQRAVIEVLGKDCFQDPDDPDRDVRIPEFEGITYPPKRPKNLYPSPF